jgi:hypothetical protein
MRKKYILALIALSSLGTLSHADYQIRIPIQHAISFNGGTSGGSGGNGGNGNGGSNGGGGLVFTDPAIAAAYEAACSGFDGYINPIKIPTRNDNFNCGNYAGLTLNGEHDLTSFRFSNFDNAILDGVNLGESNITDSSLKGVSLIGANLNPSSLARSDLTGAKLNNAIMTTTDLSNTNLTNADLSGAILTNAGFLNTNLTNVNLVGADLSNTSFTNVNFTNILYDSTTKWPSWYTPPKSSNGYQFTPKW